MFNSQQPMRRRAFEVISQSETKSAQSRKPREKKRNYAYYKGHIVGSLPNALLADQKLIGKYVKRLVSIQLVWFLSFIGLLGQTEKI